MKGIRIREDTNSVRCELFVDKPFSDPIVEKVKIAKCSPDDTYDFETGALISLMKMCGVVKVVRACNEAFSEDIFKKDYDKVKDLKEFYKKNYEDIKEHYDKLRDRNKYLIDDINKKFEYIKEKDEKIKRLNTFIRAKSILNNKLLEENSHLKYIKSCNESAIESLENTRDLLINKNNELIEENEKFKLDCEKLQHGYNDMIFCGGRQNGKQYTDLVNMFKKIDQKKFDAAYKEVYNTTLPVWQKEAPKQMYDIHKESKEKTELPRTLDINGTTYRKTIKPLRDDQLASLLKAGKYTIPSDKDGERINKLTVDSLIEENRAFTRKCVDEWLYKIPTKREKMWDRIIKLHKTNDVIIKVKKEDVNTFLHEIENKIPEITWLSTDKIFETKYTIGNIYGELKTCDIIYFRLSKETKLTYSSDSHIYLYRDLVQLTYLPPMRWDLFKKGRLDVKVTYENYKEFYEACEKELGKKPISFPMFCDNVTISINKKDGNFKIFTMEDQKKTGRKIVNWEDVR